MLALYNQKTLGRTHSLPPPRPTGIKNVLSRYGYLFPSAVYYWIAYGPNASVCVESTAVLKVFFPVAVTIILQGFMKIARMFFA